MRFLDDIEFFGYPYPYDYDVNDLEELYLWEK